MIRTMSDAEHKFDPITKEEAEAIVGTDEVTSIFTRLDNVQIEERKRQVDPSPGATTSR
jgi:hypothetical protein